MPSCIITDSKVKAGQLKTHISIKELPIPERGVVLYTDKHPEAPKGLMLKVAASGSKTWVLRYKVNGQPRRYTIGHYPDYKPARARREASDIRSDIRAKGVNGDPVAIREAEKQAEIEAQAARLNKSELTFGKLLEAYVDQLRRKGKQSTRAVETCIQKNVKLAFPKLWQKLAEDIDLDDCLEIVAALADQDKMRQAGKLRSYLRAAFTAAARARGDANAGPALRKFKLKYNPAAALATIEGSIRARDRVLSLPELKAYWQRISALPSPDGAVLRFHLLTGGQRLEQLFRLTSKDRDGDDILLLDPKGRRTKPREHIVPLLPEAKAALDEIGKGPFLVSFDGGQTPATDHQLRIRVNALSASMLEAGEIGEAFTPGDIRRTVETRLAAAKVPSDHLKHLLSHGFGGVQDRHYQRYEYHSEKLAALTVLRDLLTARGGDVVPMKRSAN
jgi:integrase